MDQRPDPDQLLKRVQADEEAAGRGRLKLFFGASPGVGKTYAMLEAARQRKKEGWDVAIGLVETHGRKETEALLDGFEILPRKEVPYKGVALKEFDLDAALARHPRLLVVDELAHTNAAGRRHAKRWQDVEELLDAGIDVYTTINVQHWETLNDVVAQITGVVVRETVPDTFLRRVHELELVDLAPEDLLTRLKEGKVYKEELAGRAAENFFRPGNLIALRELALRHTAERVDAQMQAFKEKNAIGEIWPIGERMLVGISASPASARLIRAASRMATRLHAEWIAALVETPAFLKLPAEERARAVNHLRMAEKLGAETVTLSGSDITDELLALAQSRNVTRIVLGKPANPRWQERLFGSIVSDMARRCRNIDLHIISEVGPDLNDRHPIVNAAPTGWGHLGRATVIVVSAAVMALLVNRFEGHFGFTFAVMLGAGFFIGAITGRLRQQSQALRSRAERMRALYKLSRRLSETPSLQQMLEVGQNQLEEFYEMPVLLLTPSVIGELEVKAGDAPTFGWNDNELSVARWVFDHVQIAGAGSDTLSGARGLYLPMKGIKTTIGVLALRPQDPPSLLDPEQLQMLESFAAEIGAALESTRMSEEIGRAEVHMEKQAINQDKNDGRPLIGELLSEDRIVFLPNALTKEQILQELLRPLRLPNPRQAMQVILEREKAGATLITDAVAIPHARLPGLKKIHVSLGISKEDPVRLWILFLSPADDPKTHLNFLANVAFFFRDPARAEALLGLSSAQAVLEQLRNG